MVVYILLVYLGFLIGVPNWFYWICGIMALLNVISYGVNMYKKGGKKNEE